MYLEAAFSFIFIVGLIQSTAPSLSSCEIVFCHCSPAVSAIPASCHNIRAGKWWNCVMATKSPSESAVKFHANASWYLFGTEATPWKTAGSGDWSLCWFVCCHHIAPGTALPLTYLIRGIWFLLLRVFKAALSTVGIFSLGEASLVPCSCSQSTSTRPSPGSSDDAVGSSCGFSPLGSSNSVIFTTNTKSAIIPKPLAYRTTICAGMILSEAAMTLASVQSSGSSSSWCRSGSGLPPLILSLATFCPATSILLLFMFGWINYSLNMPSSCCPESLCSAGVCRLKPPATIILI